MGQPAPHELDQTGQPPGSLGWPFRGELNVLVTSATVQLWSVQSRALRYACMHTQAHTCTHRCMHTRAHEQIHARLCTLARCVHMSTRMHARMGARAHRHMHTHAHADARSAGRSCSSRRHLCRGDSGPAGRARRPATQQRSLCARLRRFHVNVGRRRDKTRESDGPQGFLLFVLFVLQTRL